jgi:hypothetical protein
MQGRPRRSEEGSNPAEAEETRVQVSPSMACSIHCWKAQSLVTLGNER